MSGLGAPRAKLINSAAMAPEYRSPGGGARPPLAALVADDGELVACSSPDPPRIELPPALSPGSPSCQARDLTIAPRPGADGEMRLRVRGLKRLDRQLGRLRR